VKSLGQFSSSVAVIARNELVVVGSKGNLEETPLVIFTGAILKETIG
jgi:hypothetical protein